MKKFILEIFKSEQTVFSLKDIALLLENDDLDLLKSKIHYYVKKDVLKAIRRGIYVKQNFNRWELAGKIYTPTYISLESVLQKEGVIFQYSEDITAISYLRRSISIENMTVRYHKIKSAVLLNNKGLVHKKHYTIATKERAFLDALYLYKSHYFDNSDILDKKLVYKILPIYQSQALNQIVKERLEND